MREFYTLTLLLRVLSISPVLGLQAEEQGKYTVRAVRKSISAVASWACHVQISCSGIEERIDWHPLSGFARVQCRAFQTVSMFSLLTFAAMDEMWDVCLAQAHII